MTTVLACVDDATGGAPADPPAAKVERSGRGVAGADVLARWVTLGAEPGVAPGRVERVRALLNTDDRFHGVDSLAGVAPPALVELRDALRAYVESCRPGVLAELALRHPVVVTFPDGAARLASAPGAGATAAGSRLKLCGNPDCRWAYYDSSRNRSGRWCAMGECGDVMKARAYRRRARAGAGPQDGQVP